MDSVDTEHEGIELYNDLCNRYGNLLVCTLENGLLILK